MKQREKEPERDWHASDQEGERELRVSSLNKNIYRKKKKHKETGKDDAPNHVHKDCKSGHKSLILEDSFNYTYKYAIPYYQVSLNQYKIIR